MKLNSKWTWGLAWAGLAVVVAVPSADFLTGKGGKAAVLTSTTDPVVPVKTASVTTTITPSGITISPAGTPAPDAVSGYLKSNKTLPDYISGGASSSAPAQVANIDPVAPTPFPARPPDSLAPAPAKSSQPSFAATAPAEQPLIIDQPASSEPVIVDNPAPTQEAALDPAPAGPVPPEPIVDDSANWRTGGLQQYLDQNGLLSGPSGQSTASVTIVNQSDPNYDPNGFYMSDGPNAAQARRRARVERLLQDDNSDSGGFTLF